MVLIVIHVVGLPFSDLLVGIGPFVALPEVDCLRFCDPRFSFLFLLVKIQTVEEGKCSFRL